VTNQPAGLSRPPVQARSGQVGVVPVDYGAVRLGGGLRVVSLAGVVEERMIGTGEDANYRSIRPLLSAASARSREALTRLSSSP
jgi:hypothetical protein